MAHRAYVGNIPFKIGEADIREFFAGLVIEKVDVIMDRESGKPRGFAFVDFASPADLQSALGRDGMDLGGRTAVVNEARKKDHDRGARGGDRARVRDRREDDYSASWKK